MIDGERVRLMGMPLDRVTLAGAIARIEEARALGRGGAVLTPNLDVLRQYQRADALRAAFETTELLVADGVPLVWASRLQGDAVAERVTGTDMLWAITGLAARTGSLLFLAGGRPGVAERAGGRLAVAHPGLRFAAHPCFIRPGPAGGQLEELAAALLAAQPDFVLVGLPFAGQVNLVARLRAELPATWFAGVGSCYDFVNGDRARAPGWLQRAGLEWAHRVVHEPRVARRYLVDGLPFAARLGAHAVGARLRREARGR